MARAPFISQFGLTPEEVFGPTLTRLLDASMLFRDGDDYLLTREGHHYVNNVCKEFYVGDNRGAPQYMQFVPTVTAEQIAFYAERAGALSPEEARR